MMANGFNLQKELDLKQMTTRGEIKKSLLGLTTQILKLK